MITKAAVTIFDYRQNKEILIPCHRHCDAFWILKEFGYNVNVDYKQCKQGFLTDKGEFLNRVEAKKHAQACGQIVDTEFSELYSEDLW
jgi:hypothetical protein